MVFSELVSKILETRKISARDLGDAIGITGQTISNLKSGRVLKPDAKTCEALLSYCKTYGIDTSELNWNDVIRGYFFNSKYATDYEWVSDVDEHANICLRHKKCGRVTTVPIMSLSGISTPCIFCWVEAYMAQDAYSIDLDSLKTEFSIKHYRCGHSYNVSYEQIKQKKYFCPICYRSKSGENEEVSYGARQDYRFITEPERITLYESPAQPREEFIDESDDDTPLSELTFDDFLSAFDEKPRKKAEKKQQENAQRKAEEEQRLIEEARQQELDQRKAEREARKLAVAKRRAERARRREEISTISSERKFSVEYESSPYGDFSLEPGEIALLCNQCGKEVVFDFDDPALLHKIKNLTCGCKTSGLQADLLAWTAQGNIAWCADILRVISLVDLTTFNGFSFDGINNFCFPEEGDKEIFFAADPSDLKCAYAFVVYPDEIDEWLSKYLLFKFEIATWGSPQIEVEIIGRWPYYYEKLYEAICQNIDMGTRRVKEISDRNFNCYISAYDALCNGRSNVWAAGRVLSALESLSNTLNKLTGNECVSKDPHLQQYLDQHMCPVCKKMYTNMDRVCSECGFNGSDQQDTDNSFATNCADTQSTRKLVEEEKADYTNRQSEEEAQRKAEESARWRAEEERRLAEMVQRAKEACCHKEMHRLICVIEAIRKVKQQDEHQRSKQARQLISVCKRIAKNKHQEEIRRKIEEERLLAEEQRKFEEAKRLEEARRRAEEDARRRAEEERHLAEERRKFEEAKRLEEARRKAEEEKRMYFRSNNRCQHCGGEFKAFLGLFGKKCRICNRPKDY